jgi:hypothetical protein
MNQETFNGIVNVLTRGAGVMAQEYTQAFIACVNELQKRLKAEAEAEAKANKDKPAEPKPAK